MHACSRYGTQFHWNKFLSVTPRETLADRCDAVSHEVSASKYCKCTHTIMMVCIPTSTFSIAKKIEDGTFLRAAFLLHIQQSQRSKMICTYVSRRTYLYSIALACDISHSLAQTCIHLYFPVLTFNHLYSSVLTCKNALMCHI